MSIYIDASTKVITQGITGKAGRFHTEQCKEYGTQFVGGVTPGKGGIAVDGIPVYDSVKEITDKQRVDATMIFVPPPFAADAIL